MVAGNGEARPRAAQDAWLWDKVCAAGRSVAPRAHTKGGLLEAASVDRAPGYALPTGGASTCGIKAGGGLLWMGL